MTANHKGTACRRRGSWPIIVPNPPLWTWVSPRFSGSSSPSAGLGILISASRARLFGFADAPRRVNCLLLCIAIAQAGPRRGCGWYSGDSGQAIITDDPGKPCRPRRVAEMVLRARGSIMIFHSSIRPSMLPGHSRFVWPSSQYFVGFYLLQRLTRFLFPILGRSVQSYILCLPLLSFSTAVCCRELFVRVHSPLHLFATLSKPGKH